MEASRAVDYREVESRKRLEPLVARLQIPLAELVAMAAGIERLNEGLLGKRGEGDAASVRIPARLLRDVTPGGSLEVALRRCVQRRPLSTGLLDEVSEEAVPGQRALLGEIRRDLMAQGALKEPILAFDASVSASLRAELGAIAKSHGGTVVEDAARASHVVCWNQEVDGDSQENGEEYLRTLVIDERRSLALVHWWYAPDSRDEWIDIGRVRGSHGELDEDAEAWSRPLPARGEAWRVNCRFVRNVAKHREWGCELDYDVDYESAEEESEEEEEIAEKPQRTKTPSKRKRDGEDAAYPKHKHRNVRQRATPLKTTVPPSLDESESSVRSMRDVVVATLHVTDEATIELAKKTTPQTTVPEEAETAPAEKTEAQQPAQKSNVFDVNGVTSLERACCPEWFCGDRAKCPENYVEARNWMIGQSNARPPTLLTATFCRQRLSLDACATTRLFNFLDSWGLVNSQVPATARRVPKPRPRPPPFFGAQRGAESTPDVTRDWSAKATSALLKAAAAHRDDWVLVAKAVSLSDDTTFDPTECAARFVSLPLRDLAAHIDATPVAPLQQEQPVTENLDALIEARLSRIEERMDRFSKLESTLDEDRRSTQRERARLKAEWADLALNLEA